MTEEQKLIDDNNELIAIFDGWELVEEDMAQAFQKNGRWLYHYELNYHGDWNHLIKVWHKFRDLRFDEFGKLNFEHSELKQLIAREICYGNIETAFKSMVLGVKWYNSIKQ